MVTAVHFKGRTLRVRERVKGYDLVPGGPPVPAEFEIETVTSDRERIFQFLCNAAARRARP